MAVLGLMAVTIVIGLVISAATINGLAFTSTNKASVQSRSAAEAGLDVARVGTSGSACPASFSSSVTPAYNATVTYLNAAGGTVTCDLASQIRVVSTGTAQSAGVAGASSGDKSRVEAVYAYTPARTSGIIASGAALYLAAGAAINNGGAITSTGAVAALHVKTGNFECDNNTVITGNVVVVAGNLSLKKCTITGDAWVFGTATLETQGKVLGVLTAASKPPGYLGLWNATAPMPPVPGWTEFGYKKTDWVTTAGVPFTEDIRPASSGTCDLPSTSSTAPTIFNALNCAGVSSAGDVTLGNDLVIIANKFSFDKKVDFTAPAGYRVWFITPDLIPTDARASCGANQGDFETKNNFRIVPPVSAMLYTPCGIDAGNNLVWSGQMYAGKITSWNNTIFGYVGVGLPGVDMSTGTSTPGGATGTAAILGALLSQRDLTDG